MSIARAVEALLLMATEPVRATDLATQLGVPEREVLEELEQLARFYRDTERGFELCRVAGGWRLATSPDLAEVLEAAVVAETRARLSQAALETLAVIASPPLRCSCRNWGSTRWTSYRTWRRCCPTP